jgi:transcriptional regulator with XRE-family HTH domain
VTDEKAGVNRSARPALAQAVGARARALRLGSQLTLDELSTRSGVSRRMIALVEAGEANPSLGTLDKLARALGTDFASLVVAHPVAPLVPEVSTDLAPVWEDGLGSTARLLVSHPMVGAAELWQWELVPGGHYQGEPDPPGSEEIILVSLGSLVVEIGGEEFLLGPGGYLRLPTQQPYAYRNPGEDVARFVRVVVGP